MVSSIPVQLASELKLDYKPIHQYAKLLVENGLAIADNRESHGITDFLTPLTEKNYAAFVKILAKIGKESCMKVTLSFNPYMPYRIT